MFSCVSLAVNAQIQHRTECVYIFVMLAGHNSLLSMPTLITKSLNGFT